MIAHFYHQPFPILDIDEHYYLREQSLDDTKAFFEYYADPAVSRYILASIPQNLVEATGEVHYCRDMFYKQTGIYWSLAHKKDDKMVGAVGLYINNHHHRGEICYDLSKDHWQKGLMTKAMHRVMDFAMQQIGLIRIEALTIKENMASIAILKKLGYQYEGALTSYRYFNNRPHDVELFATTPALFSEHMKTNSQFAESV